MAQEKHYVVAYNDETKQWKVAPDVSVNFDAGDSWDTKTGEWTCIDDQEEDLDFSEICQILSEWNRKKQGV